MLLRINALRKRWEPREPRPTQGRSRLAGIAAVVGIVLVYGLAIVHQFVHDALTGGANDGTD